MSRRDNLAETFSVPRSAIRLATNRTDPILRAWHWRQSGNLNLLVHSCYIQGLDDGIDWTKSKDYKVSPTKLHEEWNRRFAAILDELTETL